MKQTLFCFGLLFLIGCAASIPEHSPLLNDHVSQGINRLKNQHLVILDIIYEMAINRVNQDHEKFLKDA